MASDRRDDAEDGSGEPPDAIDHAVAEGKRALPGVAAVMPAPPLRTGCPLEHCPKLNWLPLVEQRLGGQQLGPVLGRASLSKPKHAESSSSSP